MKQELTLLAAGALALSAHAQPTLTFSSNAPIAGTSYTLHYYDTYVQPGNAGAMQTWDLSALATDSTDVLEMVAPSSTPNGAEFPTATVAELSSPVITYYQVNADGIHFAGSDDGTSLIVNQPAPKYLAFPCSMGTAWTSPQASVFSYETENVYRTGQVSGVADGYGTLTMPFGTVDNVLRVHMQNTFRDSMSLFIIDYTYDNYLYYRVGQSFPIAELVSATVDFGFGQPQLVQFSRWTSDVSTGLADVPAQDNLRVYPNPASDVVNIEVPAHLTTATSVTITDGAGRVVHQEAIRGTSGSVLQLDIRHLTRGMYTVLLTDGNGQRVAARLSKR